MGYQAEKNKIERRSRVIKRALVCVVLTLLLGLCVFSAFCPPDTWKYYLKYPDVEARGEGELRIHFLDVGQGDSTLIEFPDGKTALIDGGDGRENATTAILRHLNALGIDTLDYLIATHADGDHCGGFAEILEHKKVFNAYLPTVNPENAGGKYAAFYAQLLKENCTRQFSSRGISLNGEGEYSYTFSFLYPYSSEANGEAAEENSDVEDNALSSVLWLDYHGVSALFTGDAPFETEELLMRDDGLGLFDRRGVELSSTEILKVAHHGSANSTSLEFLRYLQVQTAVISCGENNLYGHPSEEVKANLQNANAELYRTDEDGTVIVTVSADGRYTVSKLD